MIFNPECTSLKTKMYLSEHKKPGAIVCSLISKCRVLTKKKVVADLFTSSKDLASSMSRTVKNRAITTVAIATHTA